jgi:hypothetical protein
MRLSQTFRACCKTGVPVQANAEVQGIDIETDRHR